MGSKRKSKKTPTVAIVETKTGYDTTEQTSTLVAIASNGGKIFNMSTLVSNSAWMIDSSATNHDI